MINGNNMNIWIFNHYATNMFYDKAGRHHSIAKFLVKKGHSVTIFCANTIHGRKDEIQISNGRFLYKKGADEIGYIFVKSTPYETNGIDRIKNMHCFYRNMFHVYTQAMKKVGSPDIIWASSVHPLTLIAGIKIAKKMKKPCICEVRDLWPETFVALGKMKRENFITKILYKGEHWIYKKADGIIFTMPGGAKYIEDRGWQNDISYEKIYHVNNGVDLDKFTDDRDRYTISDSDLNNKNMFKVVYAGSIREANRVEDFVSMAKVLNDKEKKDIKLIIYGDGDQREKLERECSINNLDNISFKGSVEKKYIPYILSKGNLNVVTDEQNELGKYGISWNKIFEYMASGKPAVINYDMGEYDMVKSYGFGQAKAYRSIEEFTEAVIDFADMTNEEYNRYADNAEKAAASYDYKVLADKMEKIFFEYVNMRYERNSK